MNVKLKKKMNISDADSVTQLIVHLYYSIHKKIETNIVSCLVMPAYML
jgi:hypothetical protein